MTAARAELLVDTRQTARRLRRRRVLHRYLLAFVGGAVVLFWLLVMAAGPSMVRYPPNMVLVDATLLPPSLDHPFGTDQLGRDVFSRLLVGTRVSLPTGLIVVLAAGLFGALYGGVAAYAHGRIEEGMMRFTDLFFCFPPLILAMAIAAALGAGWRNTLLAMTIVWWPKYARMGRSLVLVQRSREYVEAAEALGGSPVRILLRHITPNSLGPLVTFLTLDIGNAIVTFAGLSFLGLGVVPPTSEWGAMVSQGQALIQQWWVSLFPGLAIFTVAMGFNFLGDGLRDWLDPRARQR
jgi:peptide/nickel transport system permease protein